MSANVFFERELPGEPALTLATAKLLCELSATVEDIAPWEDVNESDLFFIGDPAQESLACSVMGTLGAVFAVIVYRGEAGLRWFTDLQQAPGVDPGKFTAEQESVMVQFVKRSELKKQDKDLLAAAKYPAKKGRLVPRFRSSRFGYHPWFINEEEGRILAMALEASIVVTRSVLEFGESGQDVPYWQHTGQFPQLILDNGKSRLEPYQPPLQTLSMPKVPVVDERRINPLLKASSKKAGTLELDVVWLPVEIGEANQRKSCLRLAIAIDAESAKAFPPVTDGANGDAATMLQDALLSALEKGASPSQIHLSDKRYRIMLEPLAKTLGLQLKVVPELPALEFMKASLLGMMTGAPPMAPF